MFHGSTYGVRYEFADNQLYGFRETGQSPFGKQ
jgi:hypothetical protein